MKTPMPSVLGADELKALIESCRLSGLLSDTGLRALSSAEIDALNLAFPSKTVSCGVLASSRGRLILVLLCAPGADNDSFSISGGAQDQLALCVPAVMQTRLRRSALISYYLLNRTEHKAILIGKERQTSDPLILTPPVMGDLIIDITFE